MLVALGGGPRTRLGGSIGLAILSRRPDTKVIVAGGMIPSKASQALGIDWLTDPSEFASAMRAATVVVSGGGITLYECAAAGVPAVAVAVVPAQRPTIDGFLRGGAVRDGGDIQGRQRQPLRVAAEVCALLDDPAARRTLVHAGRTLVDGRGLSRVCRAILGLMVRRGGPRAADTKGARAR